MVTKILVTGANGQLGQTIQKKSKSTLKNMEFVFATREDLDISNPQQVTTFFKQYDFNYCINCAAYTNVELAETDVETAYKINAEGVRYLAESCEKHKTVLIHISTDYVFDGTKTKPYSEEDLTNPINQYGKSKLQGEHYIQQLLSDYYIIRTSWLYSAFGKNFAKTISNKLKNGNDLKVMTSETGTPTSCNDLAELILFLIEHNSQAFGLYHFSASGKTTWYGFASLIAEYIGKENLVTAVEHYPMKAKRPTYSVLDNTKANKLIGKKFQWQASVNEVLDELLKC